MRTLAAACSVLICVTLAAAAQQPSVADANAPADAAYAQGKSDEALKLYEQVLAKDPQNIHALVRSGMLLSWKGDYAEAVRRYDRALAADPGNSFARMERAKVLSWARQFPQAIAAFRQILAAEPSNLEAQLGVARVLSWSGDQAQARLEYMKVLERDPRNPEALVGVGQTYAWTGKSAAAREWYEKALAARPKMREALVGIAYLDLAEGDVYAAWDKTSQLESQFPKDKDVLELKSAVTRARAPMFRFTFDRTDDTEENQSDLFGVETGFALPRRSDLTIGYSRYEISDLLRREGTIQSGFLSLVLRPTAAQRIVLRPGIERFEKTDGSRGSEPVGRISYAAGVGRPVELTLEAERRSFRATTGTLNAGVMIDAYAATLLARPHPSLRIVGTGAVWNLSDGNERTGFDGTFAYVWPAKAVRIETGYVFHYFDYQKDLSNGYFDPKGYTAHAGAVDLHKEFRPVYFHVFAESGVQTFDFQGVRTDGDRYVTYAGTLGFRLTPTVSLELSGIKSDSSVQNPAGFESTQYSARLRMHTR
ncbi:MAG TPA: tetratricopeptide repeat protein [Thermoanaerobaculia bacterium]|nr:tetratricopeptide repeat protein [Thermoanaerobaculia bacterium]